MNLFDFSKTDQDGRCIFGSLMQKGIVAARTNYPLLGSLMSKIEEFFFFMISAAKEHLDDEEIDRIIESPDQGGAYSFRKCFFFIRENQQMDIGQKYRGRVRRYSMVDSPIFLQIKRRKNAREGNQPFCR